MEVAFEKAIAVEDDELIESGPGSLAEQLVALPNTDWALWRTVCLRGAGFPATGVLKLATPECAAAADHVLERETAAGRPRPPAFRGVNKRRAPRGRGADGEKREGREPLVSA